MKKILILSGFTLLLAACGSDSPEAQMQQAVNDAAAYNRICVPYRLNAEESGSKPALFGAAEIRLPKRNEDGGRINEAALAQMSALAKAGLYREEAEEKSGEGKDAVRTAVYSLTDTGKEHIRIGHHGALLCIGSSHAEHIDYFTEPTPHGGYTVTQVHYTARAVPEKWAKKLVKSDPQLQAFKDKFERSSTLVKTNDGWRDIRTLN